MEKIKKRDVTVVHSEGPNIYGDHGAVIVALGGGHAKMWSVNEIPEEDGWEEHYKFMFAQSHNNAVDRQEELVEEREMMKTMIDFLRDSPARREGQRETAKQLGLTLMEGGVSEEAEPPVH